MKLLTLVNLRIRDTYGNNNIVAACIDLNPDHINQIINSHDGVTNVVMSNGVVYEIIAPFMEIFNVVSEYANINTQYKDEVVEYLGENWEAYKQRTNYENGDKGEEGTAHV